MMRHSDEIWLGKIISAGAAEQIDQLIHSP